MLVIVWQLNIPQCTEDIYKYMNYVENLPLVTQQDWDDYHQENPEKNQ